MLEAAKGSRMLTIPGNARLFICQHPVNMRKSFEGLSAIVEELFPDFAKFSDAPDIADLENKVKICRGIFISF